MAGVITYIYFIPAKAGIKSGRWARDCFICASFDYIFELAVTELQLHIYS